MLRSIYERISAARGESSPPPAAAPRPPPAAGAGKSRTPGTADDGHPDVQQHQRRQLRVAEIAQRHLPACVRHPALRVRERDVSGCALQFALDLQRRRRHQQQRQCLHRGRSRPPNGSQVAFLKDNASISQTVYLDAGVYNLSFLAAQRLNCQTQQQEIEVLIDDTNVGQIAPAAPVVVNNTTVDHLLYLLPDAEFHGRGGPAQRRAPRFGSGHRRQHRLHQRRGNHAGGGRDRGRGLRDAGPGRQRLRDATLRLGLAVLAERPASARNGSDFATNWVVAQNAPAGAQVAYLQCVGSMSQTMYLDAGTYQLSFLAAQRAIYQDQLRRNRDPARRHALLNGDSPNRHSRQHPIRLLPVVDVYRGGRAAYDRVPRRGPPGRRQHGLHRPGECSRPTP